MPNAEYEAARAVADTAGPDAFELTPYLGGVADFSYLRKWVVDNITAIYDVDASDFETATVLSTSILRDFVHRALFQTTDPNTPAEVMGSGDYLGSPDVANALRYLMSGTADDTAKQLYAVYTAFGYQTSLIETINDDVSSFTDSHVMTSVTLVAGSVPDEIIQDPTYNFLYLDEDGNILDFLDAREILADGGDLTLDPFDNYHDYHLGVVDFPATLADYIRDNYLEVVRSWSPMEGIGTQAQLPGHVNSLDRLFANPEGAHDPAVWQGATVADEAAAIDLATGAPGDWPDALAYIRSNGFYVSAFQIGDSYWTTLRLSDGSYVSISVAPSSTVGELLYGSYDELVHEAANGPAANPGADLSAFLGRATLIDHDGLRFTLGGGDLNFPWNTPPLAPVAPIEVRGSGAIFGTTADERILGSDGNDTINGGGGADYLFGGKGDDVYVGAGFIIEQAGEGYDTITVNYHYTLAQGVSIEALTTYGTATTNAINLTGNELNNLLLGNNGINILDGGAGADELRGYGGDDTYYVDETDTVVELSGGGRDTVFTRGTHALRADAHVESLRIVVTATTNAANLTGSDTDNFIVGNDGANVIDGRGGADEMWGWGGDDTYVIDNVGDRIIEASGSAGGYDTVVVNMNYTLPDIWVEGLKTFGTGTTNAINLTGNNLDNRIEGNNGANIIDGREGVDTLIGNGGDDTFFVRELNDTVVEAAGGGYDTVIAQFHYALQANAHVEVLRTYGSATTHAINLTGSDINNLIVGNNGVNVIDGRGGVDDMYGYLGDDTYLVDNVGDIVNEAVGGGYDTVITNVSYTLAAGANIEVLKTYGSATTQAINLTGNGLANVIVGNAAANTINGAGGADQMTGAGGDDTYLVDNVGDIVNETVGGGYDTVVTNISYTLKAGSSIEVLRTYGSATTNAINLTGNAFDNLIVGNAGANVINGAAGADDMWGYGGDDTYYVDTAADTVHEAAGGGYDTVVSNVSYTLAAGVAVEALSTWGSATTQNMNLTGNEFDNLIVGNSGLNTLSGGGGADTIWGYGGADVLDGGAGNDTLKGGDGADRFVLAASNAGSDRVLDFDIGEDRFALAAGQHFTTVSTADVNGDGVLDTVLGHAGGTVTVYGWAGAVASDDLGYWNGLTVIG